MEVGVVRTSVFISWKSEGDAVLMDNPFQGMAQVYVSLRDRFGKKYDLGRHLIPIIQRYFRGATITPPIGIWKSQPPEPTVIVTLVNDTGKRAPSERTWLTFIEKVRKFSKETEVRLRQSKVLVQFVPPMSSESEFEFE